MKVLLFCCYTPAHEVLYREIFLPSVPAGFEVGPHIIEESGPGDFLSPEFLSCIRKKIDLVLKTIEQNSGRLIVWSDVDIRFFDLVPGDLENAIQSSGKDILFQRESPRMTDVNTGFFVCRCGPTVREFFESVRSELSAHPEENEQMVVNGLLQGRKGSISNTEKGMQSREPATNVSWGYLSKNFYARTHGWPPPRRLMLYHANFTKGPDGIGQKFSQFREIEKVMLGGLLAWFWSIVRRAPKKFFQSRSEQ